MTFYSILFESPEDDVGGEAVPAPAFFADLNLDQVVDAITDGYEDYNLAPFFSASLKSVGAIEYRHQVMRELGEADVSEVIGSFSVRMQTMRQYLAQAERL